MSSLDKGDGGGVGVGSSSSSLLNQPIVMDVGTDTTKAGFAGGSKPKVRDYVYNIQICLKSCMKCGGF